MRDSCDSPGAWVRIVCFECKAIDAAIAINLANMAIFGDGKHTVSLDKKIASMRYTEQDMQSSCRKTSCVGLCEMRMNFAGRLLNALCA